MKNKIGFYLMNEKGLKVLSDLITSIDSSQIGYVIGARDKGVKKDYYDEIQELCKSEKILFKDRKECDDLEEVEYKIAIGWRWIIKEFENLIVFHDSLLPKYRGFAPLVNALINGEKEVGVTALFANKSFDRGDIIMQEKVSVDYPITIQKAISKVSELYGKLAGRIAQKIIAGEEIYGLPQNEDNASYSLWRDADDYRINWEEDASKIERTIHALGFPYLGAASSVDNVVIRIIEAEAITDVRIENRTAGKVLFIEEGNPIIVCGKGLLRILEMKTIDGIDFVLPKFRARFV